MSIRRVVLVVVLAVLSTSLVAVTWLVAPAPEAAAAPGQSTPPGKRGVASASAEGLAQAKRTRKPVEVTAANTETTTVYANPNGTMTQVISQVPIRVRNKQGDLVKVNHKLTKSGQRLVSAASPADVSVSADGSDTLAALDPDGVGSLSLSFGDDLGRPTISGATATYPVVGDSTATVTASTSSTGFSVHVHLSAAPDQTTDGSDLEYRFPIAANGLTPRLVAATTLEGPGQRELVKISV